MIKIKNAAFAYDKEKIFENISLEINPGEIFCLFGPNGCGKSTLIQCILGILRFSIMIRPLLSGYCVPKTGVLLLWFVLTIISSSLILS